MIWSTKKPVKSAGPELQLVTYIPNRNIQERWLGDAQFSVLLSFNNDRLCCRETMFTLRLHNNCKFTIDLRKKWNKKIVVFTPSSLSRLPTRATQTTDREVEYFISSNCRYGFFPYLWISINGAGHLLKLANQGENWVGSWKLKDKYQNGERRRSLHVWENGQGT